MSVRCVWCWRTRCRFGNERDRGTACRRPGRGDTLRRCVGGCVRHAPRQAKWSRRWTGRTAGSPSLSVRSSSSQQTVEVLKAATTFFVRECDPRPSAPENSASSSTVHRERFGVAPICRALTRAGLKIAPNTFYAWRRRGPSKRALWDATITEVLAGYYQPDDAGPQACWSRCTGAGNVGPPAPGGHRGGRAAPWSG